MPPRKQAAARANGSTRESRLPGIKHNAPKSTRNFFPSDSDDSVAEEPARRKAVQQPTKTKSILGGTNSLKAMFSNSQEAPKNDLNTPSSVSTPVKKRPGKRGRKPKQTSIPSPEVPLHEASTPKSMLKRATKSLHSPSDSKPIRFDDIEEPPSPSVSNTTRHREDTKPLPKKRRTKPSAPKKSVFDESIIDEAEINTSSRRSSYGARGKRVSSIGNGFVAKPHEEMSVKDYYKVVDSSLPGPSRLRQILVWCFKKKLQQDREKGGAESNTATGIAKVIENELLDDLIAKKIDTSWLSTKRIDSSALQGKRIVKSNPLNDANRENIEVFKQKLRELRQEKVQWQNAFDASMKPLQGLGISSADKNSKDNADFEEYVKQKDPKLEAVLREDHFKKVSQDLKDVKANVPEKLEANMAQLFHAAYQLNKSVELVRKIKDDSLAPQVSSVVKEFMERGQNSEKVTKIGTRELLRGISRVDLRQQ